MRFRVYAPGAGLSIYCFLCSDVGVVAQSLRVRMVWDFRLGFGLAPNLDLDIGSTPAGTSTKKHSQVGGNLFEAHLGVLMI